MNASSQPWNKLTPELLQHLAGLLPVPDVVAGLKLSCKDAAACLREGYSLIQLSAQPAQRRQPNKWVNPVVAASPWPARQFVAHWGRPEPWRTLVLRQRQRLLCLAASSGDGPSLDAALAHCGCALNVQVMAAAAAAGRTAACERLLQEGCMVGLAAVCAAAEAGHLHLCTLLWARQCTNHTHNGNLGGDAVLLGVAEAASSGGHAHVLQWLEEEGGLFPEVARWDYDGEYRRQEVAQVLAAAAARGGHVALLYRLLARLPPPPRADGREGGMWHHLLCDVALGCPLPLLRQLAGRWRQLQQVPRQQQPAADADADADADVDADADAAQAAAGGGRPNLLLLRALGSRTPDWRDKAEWVLSRRPELLAAATDERRGNGGRWRGDGCWLLDGGGEYGWAAAQPDYKERLRYLVRDRGVRALPAAAVEAAAAVGDVRALRFLRYGCGGMRWPNSCVVETAAQRGQLAVLDGVPAGPAAAAAELQQWRPHPGRRRGASGRVGGGGGGGERGGPCKTGA